MKISATQIALATVMAAVLSPAAWASPLSPAVRTVIPSDVRQIISVDYSLVKTISLAMQLKAQALPENLREFENALKSVGVTPERNLGSLTFASFDLLENGKLGLAMVGVASGSFSSKSVLTEILLQKIKAVKYRDSDVYPVSKTMSMTFLDDNTVLLGKESALRIALNVHEGHTSSVDTNRATMTLVKSVQKAPVWSVLDQQGSQNMLSSALGESAQLPDFGHLKAQVLGSRYMITFKRGVEFYLDVLTPDTASSSKLSLLLKAGILYKKATANSAQKVALENMTVASEPLTPTTDHSHLKMQFKVNQAQFENLLKTQCFTAMSGERKELSGVTSDPVADASKPTEDRSAKRE